MSIGIFWVLFAIAVGVYASNRGRSGLGWFVLSLVISPLLGLIFVAVSKDLSKPASAGPSASTHRSCPHCAELILPDAKVCKHCGRDVPADPGYAQRQARAVKEAQAQEQINLFIGIGAVVLLFLLAGLASRCSS